MKDWYESELRLSTDATVGALVSSKVIENNRYCIQSMAEVIQFLALNELSLRGDYDKTEGKEMGHFVNLFEYTLMKDTKLAEIQKRIPQNAKCTSPNIQNDIINEMASMVTSGVGGGGSGRRHWPPRLVSKCRNFGQFYIVWAILHQNFGQFDIHQTVSISVKTFFFSFGGHLNSDRKTVSISGEDLFFFGGHLNSDRKTVSILVKTFIYLFLEVT